MWDTAGSERFKSLIPTYLKNAHALILTFDITNKASFLSLPNWLKEIEDKLPENAYIMVVGNKLDMENKRWGQFYLKYFRQVSQEEAKKFCDDFKLQYIETSAKSGTNVKKIFEMITYSMYENQNYPIKEKTIILEPNNKNQEIQKRSVKCCNRWKVPFKLFHT